MSALFRPLSGRITSSVPRMGSKEKLRSRTGSKESMGSETSSVVGSTTVRLGKASKQGTNHANEDRVVAMDSLSDLLDEEVMAMSEALEMFALDGKLAAEPFMDSVLLAAVFDGHGGATCSEFLARELQVVLARSLDKHKVTDMDKAGEILAQTFGTLEEDFLKEAVKTMDTSGACAVTALVWGKEVFVAHCGDCRAVLRTSDGETVHLTRDHRAGDPGERVRVETAGGIIVDDRVFGVLAPTRSFGDLDMKEKKGVVIAEPELVRYSVRAFPTATKKFTFMILASDGVWDVMSSDAACDYVSKILSKSGGNADLAAARLVATCAKYNQDDVSACVFVWQQQLGAELGKSPSNATSASGRKTQVGAGSSASAAASLTPGSASAFNLATETIAENEVFDAATRVGDSEGYESDTAVSPDVIKKGVKSVASSAKLLRASAKRPAAPS